jgi:hypothetical protein
MSFRCGTPVLLRSTFADHVGAVVPSVVIVDAPDEVAVYQSPGTTMLLRTGRRGGPNGRNMYPDGWDGGHTEVPWVGAGVVRVHRPGQPWSVWRWLDPSGWRPGFYVNLERPWVRGPLGYDSTDWILDLVIDSDGTAHWKDADELAWSVEVGAVTEAFAHMVRAAGQQALAALGGWPFDADWDRWRPDSAWPVAGLTVSQRQSALLMG